MTAKLVSHSLNKFTKTSFCEEVNRSTYPVGYGQGSDKSEGVRCGITYKPLRTKPMASCHKCGKKDLRKRTCPRCGPLDPRGKITAYVPYVPKAPQEVEPKTEKGAS